MAATGGRWLVLVERGGLALAFGLFRLHLGSIRGSKGFGWRLGVFGGFLGGSFCGHWRRVGLFPFGAKVLVDLLLRHLECLLWSLVGLIGVEG